MSFVPCKSLAAVHSTILPDRAVYVWLRAAYTFSYHRRPEGALVGLRTWSGPPQQLCSILREELDHVGSVRDTSASIIFFKNPSVPLNPTHRVTGLAPNKVA